MAEHRKLADNVVSFLDRASEDYGRIQADKFSQYRFCEMVDAKSDSPIEDLFWIACHVQCASVTTEINNEIWVAPRQYAKGAGVHITPQYQVGKYRADFLLEQVQIGPDSILTPVIVELDGHAFHDRDKHQRSYEKARDREFQRSGFKVLHFTGSDVFADPYKVAFEALQFIGAFCGTGRESYDPADPFGRGV